MHQVDSLEAQSLTALPSPAAATVRLPLVTDIGEPAVQRKLQAHFDVLGGFPPAGSEAEYSAYFEATYHSPKDRRAYLDELIARLRHQGLPKTVNELEEYADLI